MKELRSAVNAVFLFAVFLLVYAALTPGHAKGSSNPPRFLRMQFEDAHDHPGTRVTVQVPYFFIRSALRFAALGRLHRELEFHFDEDFASEELRELLGKLEAAKEGEIVVCENDDEVCNFRREGSSVIFDCGRQGDDPAERVEVRVPSRLIEAAVTDGRDFDVDSLISELRSAKVGDLVEVKARDAHVKVWVE